MARPAPKPRFFATPEAFGAWLAKYGAKKPDLVVGYWKVGTGKPSMTWTQSVEQALMHGWIDGVRHSLGDEAYTIRFTPRRRGSNWSAINRRTAKRLVAEGRMAPAGAAAYAARDKKKPLPASYEQRAAVQLDRQEVRRFKADAKAWAWFQAAPPSYQKACRWWIVSAKRPETRERRLAHVMAHAHAGEVAPQYRWRSTKRKGAEGRGGEAV